MLYGDIPIIAISFLLLPSVLYKIFPNPLKMIDTMNVILASACLFVLYSFYLYNIRQRIKNINFTFRFLLAVTMINIVNVSVIYLVHLRDYNSLIIFISSSLTVMLLIIWRLVFISMAGVAKKPLRIIIFGAGSSGRGLYDLLKTNAGYRVVGFVDDDRAKRDLNIDGLRVLGGREDLITLTKRYDVNKVIVCVGKSIQPDVYPRLVEANFGGVQVCELPTFYEKIAGKIPVLQTSDVWFGYADISGVKRNIYNTLLKNILDKLLAVIVLILTAPLIILTAALIKLESKGPVFYSQKRVGLNEEIFVLHKFRSMHIDAEANGAVWAQENDPRTTRVGKVIRLLRIDELPQLWNVLMGEMSFVGPRPERPEFVRELKKEIPYYAFRHSVLPGITGWAQINYNYGASKEDAREKLQFDLYYIKNEAFWLDLSILLQTIPVMLFGIGAR